MNIFSKRLSVVALSVTTIMWAVGAMQAPVAHAVAAGSLIKASGPAVYYLAADGKRYTFPNDKIYRSWYSDFSGVQVISDAELASYYIGGNVKYRAGTRLVKITTDPRVYAVEPTGTLRHIPDEATAIALYGANWAQMVDDLPDAFFAPPNYNIGTALPTGGATLPSGYLATDGSTTYLIDGSAKRPISGQSAMDANRFWSMYVHTVPASTLNGYSNGTSINGADSALLDVSQGGTGSVVVPTGSNVTVALASDTPVAMTVPDGTIYNPLLKFNVTASADGDAQLTGVTITRGGFIANTNVTGVSVWDQNGMRHGSILTALTSDGMGTISFTGEPIVIPAGQTRSVTVAANISGDANSATVNFSVAGSAHLAFTNSPSVNGVFPIMGNTMSVVDGSSSVGAVQVDAQPSVGNGASTDAGNLEVGNAQMEVAKFNFSETSSREDIQVRQLTFYVEGDINEATDLANFTVYGPDGVALGSAARATNRYVTVNFTSPYTIPQGQNRNLTVKVDATGGANRWFRLQLQNDYDVLVRGVTTGANVLPVDGDGGSWTSEVSANGYFKMKQGELTIVRNSASPTGNLTLGATNVELARFDITANGENLELQKFALATSKFFVFTGNLSIVDMNGTVYYTGTANATTTYNTSGLTTQTSFSNYISLTAGQTKTLKVMGNVNSNSYASGQTIQITLGNFYARRLNSLDYTNVATGGQAANGLNIGTSSLTITKHATPSDPNSIAPGTQDATFATFVVSNQAAGSEDVRLNSVNVTINGNQYTSAATQMTNLKLWDLSGTTPVQLGSTRSSVASTSNSFSINWTIPANQSKVLGVSATFNSSIPSGAIYYATLADGNVVGTGLSSNNSYDAPAADTNGQMNSMAAASVRAYFESNSNNNSKIATAGTQGFEVGSFRFEVLNEDVQLYKFAVTVSTTAATTGTAPNASGTAVFTGFSLYNGTTLLGSTNCYQYDQGLDTTYLSNQLAGASSTCDALFTFGTPVTLPRDVGGVLTLKTNIANSGSGVTTTVFSMKIKSNSSNDLDLRSNSSSSITATLQSSGGILAETNKHLYIDTAPVIVSLPVGSYHVRGINDEIARFEVRNYGQVAMTLNQLGFSFNAGGFSSSTSAMDYVHTFVLFDDNGLQLASANTAASLCGGANISIQTCSAATTATTTTFTVPASNSVVPASTGGNYGSRVFSIRANTSNVAANSGSSQATRSIQVQATGTRGFLSSDSAMPTNGGTRYWNSGGVLYKFTPAGYSGFYSVQQDASDSYPVTSAQVTYQ